MYNKTGLGNKRDKGDMRSLHLTANRKVGLLNPIKITAKNKQPMRKV